MSVKQFLSNISIIGRKTKPGYDFFAFFTNLQRSMNKLMLFVINI